ncbi:MAG TPA: hypothetical protein VHQ98_02850 [Gaiellaceae bacterium]|nr:hypothetical protein [Gaiellaceae bacterium]
MEAAARCAPTNSGARLVEEDLGDTDGLFEGREVAGVGERDRPGVSKESEIGFTF